MTGDATFQSRANRDKRWLELKKEFPNKKFERGHSKNQCLHPQYVEDFEGPEKDDTGFGNMVYKTFFPRLYHVRAYDFWEGRNTIY